MSRIVRLVCYIAGSTVFLPSDDTELRGMRQAPFQPPATARAALQGGDSKLLQQWIEKPRQSEFGPIVRFAYGLKKDIAALSPRSTQTGVNVKWKAGLID